MVDDDGSAVSEGANSNATLVPPFSGLPIHRHQPGLSPAAFEQDLTVWCASHQPPAESWAIPGRLRICVKPEMNYRVDANLNCNWEPREMQPVANELMDGSSRLRLGPERQISMRKFVPMANPVRNRRCEEEPKQVDVADQGSLVPLQLDFDVCRPSRHELFRGSVGIHAEGRYRNGPTGPMRRANLEGH